MRNPRTSLHSPDPASVFLLATRHLAGALAGEQVRHRGLMPRQIFEVFTDLPRTGVPCTRYDPLNVLCATPRSRTWTLSVTGTTTQPAHRLSGCFEPELPVLGAYVAVVGHVARAAWDGSSLPGGADRLLWAVGSDPVLLHRWDELRASGVVVPLLDELAAAREWVTGLPCADTVFGALRRH